MFSANRSTETAYHTKTALMPTRNTPVLSHFGIGRGCDKFARAVNKEAEDGWEVTGPSSAGWARGYAGIALRKPVDPTQLHHKVALVKATGPRFGVCCGASGGDRFAHAVNKQTRSGWDLVGESDVVWAKGYTCVKFSRNGSAS